MSSIWQQDEEMDASAAAAKKTTNLLCVDMCSKALGVWLLPFDQCTKL
jgi:hypothetical protein